MDNKQKGDIAESAAILEAHKRGWAVLKPFSERSPYDLVFDINGRLLKVQVKSAGLSSGGFYYAKSVRNSRTYATTRPYKMGDFDFGLYYLPHRGMFFVIPIERVLVCKKHIYLGAANPKMPKKMAYAEYEDAWHLLEKQPQNINLPVLANTTF